ncbi:hypothetical protein AB0K12_20495 [Nonomuraea sp. NPDC049419]|uniref:hypothetical protein n=1 Tax=Nonomuraea sp. NPDC049419 TaxID=3155772 RepID=UPI00342FA443
MSRGSLVGDLTPRWKGSPVGFPSHLHLIRRAALVRDWCQDRLDSWTTEHHLRTLETSLVPTPLPGPVVRR